MATSHAANTAGHVLEDTLGSLGVGREAELGVALDEERGKWYACGYEGNRVVAPRMLQRCCCLRARQAL